MSIGSRAVLRLNVKTIFRGNDKHKRSAHTQLNVKSSTLLFSSIKINLAKSFYFFFYQYRQRMIRSRWYDGMQVITCKIYKGDRSMEKVNRRKSASFWYNIDFFQSLSFHYYHNNNKGKIIITKRVLLYLY